MFGIDNVKFLKKGYFLFIIILFFLQTDVRNVSRKKFAIEVTILAALKNLITLYLLRFFLKKD
jgi:hypothetical protein